MTCCLSGKQGQQTAQSLPLTRAQKSQLRKQSDLSAAFCSLQSICTGTQSFPHSYIFLLIHPNPLQLSPPPPWRSHRTGEVLSVLLPLSPLSITFLPSPYTAVVTSKSCPSLWDSEIQTSCHTIRTGSKHNWTTCFMH